jgi:hypothetical protein
MIMRRYTSSYYYSRAKLRNYLSTKIIAPHSTNPYKLDVNHKIGHIPIIRLHVRRHDSLMDVYRVFAILAETVLLARDAIRVYIINQLANPNFEDRLRNIDRSVSALIQQVYKKDLLYGIVIGEHAPERNRMLIPLRDLTIDGIEAGVDLILQPAGTARRLVSAIKHTKFYVWRLKL